MKLNYQLGTGFARHQRNSSDDSGGSYPGYLKVRTHSFNGLEDPCQNTPFQINSQNGTRQTINYANSKPRFGLIGSNAVGSVESYYGE
jgi:hypothetical protein